MEVGSDGGEREGHFWMRDFGGYSISDMLRRKGKVFITKVGMGSREYVNCPSKSL